MLSQAFKAARLFLDCKDCTFEGYYLIIWYFIVLSLIQYWLGSQPFWVHGSFLSVGDDCLHFRAFSQEMYPFQNAAWTNFLAFEGRAKVCYNEKGIIYNTIFLPPTGASGFIDIRWRIPIVKFSIEKLYLKPCRKFSCCYHSWADYMNLCIQLLAFTLKWGKGQSRLHSFYSTCGIIGFEIGKLRF